MRTERMAPAASNSYSLLRDIASAAAASGTVKSNWVIERLSFLSSGGACQFFASHAPMLTGSCCGRERQQCIASGLPASSSPFEVGQGEYRLVTIDAGEWFLAALPLAAGSAECSHGCGVAAAFRCGMAPVAPPVRPAAGRPVGLRAGAPDSEG